MVVVKILCGLVEARAILLLVLQDLLVLVKRLEKVLQLVTVFILVSPLGKIMLMMIQYLLGMPLRRLWEPFLKGT